MNLELSDDVQDLSLLATFTEDIKISVLGSVVPEKREVT